MRHSVLRQALDESSIVVVTSTFVEEHGEDYAEALRSAIGIVRGGTQVEVMQGNETLHTTDELALAAEALGPFPTDEELVEEVHYAARKLEGVITR